MADISKSKKHFGGETASVEFLYNWPPNWIFTIGETQVDLSRHRRSEADDDIAWYATVAIWRERGAVSEDSLKRKLTSLNRFFEFRDTIVPDVCVMTELTTEIAQEYAYWLKNTFEPKIKSKYRSALNQNNLAESTQAKYWSILEFIVQGYLDDGFRLHNLILSRNLFDRTIKEQVRPYSDLERRRIIRACTKDIATVRKGINPSSHSNAEVGHRTASLLPYFLMFACRTGLNPKVISDLKTDCIQLGYIGSTSRICCPVKGRSGRSQNIPIENKDAEHPRIDQREAAIINEVIDLTKRMREKADSSLVDLIWLYEKVDGRIVQFGYKIYAQALPYFVKRHKLKGDDGSELHLAVKRFRPSFAESILKQSNGNIMEVKKRLNHKSLRTTMEYFDPNQEHRRKQFKFSGLAMQTWALEEDGEISIETLVNELGLTSDEAQKLISGDFNMGVTKCRNPYKSPLKGVPNGEVCRNYLACFRCPNMVILREDAHRLFSFYWYLQEKRQDIESDK